MLQGDSCQFSADTLVVTPAAAAATTVTFVTASSTAGVGNHTFTVVADDGNVIKRYSAAVTVTSLHMWNLPSQMQSGIPGTISAQFLVSGIAPFMLSCSGLPAGAICSFSGNQVTYPSNSGLTMTIAVPAGTPPGNYPVQVTVT